MALVLCLTLLPTAALVLCLTLLPTAALAGETEGTAQTPPAVSIIVKER